MQDEGRAGGVVNGPGAGMLRVFRLLQRPPFFAQIENGDHPNMAGDTLREQGTAINVEARASHECGFIRGKEGHKVGDFV